MNSNPKRVSKALWEYIYKDKNEEEVFKELEESFYELEESFYEFEEVFYELEESFYELKSGFIDRSPRILSIAAKVICFFKDRADWCKGLRSIFDNSITKKEDKIKRNDISVILIINEMWDNLPYSKEEFLDTIYFDEEIMLIYELVEAILPTIKNDKWNKKVDNIIYDCANYFLDWKGIRSDFGRSNNIMEIGKLSKEDAYLLIGFIQSRMAQMFDGYAFMKVQLSNKCLQLSSNAQGVTVIDNTEELEALQNENNLLSINNKKLQDEKDNLQALLNVFLKEEKREENEEIRDLKKQVALLENQILEKDAKLKEFENYTKILDGSSEAMLDIIEDYDLDFLKSKRFLFIGGREETNRELEKIFPNAKFVNNENVNIFINDKISNCSFLPDSMKMLNTRTQFDYIVFFPKFMNHALFYKYKKEGLNRNIPYMLINFNNIDLILKNMYLEIITGADAEIA